MGVSTATTGIELVEESKKPIRIYGVPSLLEGNIHLLNTTGSKLTLKSMLLGAPKLKNVALQPLNEVPIAARLYPGQQDAVHFEFPIAANTPPGIYEAALQVGNKTQAAQIQVNSVVDILLTPDEVTLYTKGKSRFEMEFEVTNEGNITVNMGEMLSTPLLTETSLQTQLHKALLEISDDNDDRNVDDSILDDVESLDRNEHSSLLNKLLSSLSKHQAGDMTMSWDNSPLAPGKTLSFKSFIELPDDLPLNRHYIAELEILSESLQVHIYTYGA